MAISAVIERDARSLSLSKDEASFTDARSLIHSIFEQAPRHLDVMYILGDCRYVGVCIEFLITSKSDLLCFPESTLIHTELGQETGLHGLFGLVERATLHSSREKGVLELACVLSRMLN